LVALTPPPALRLLHSFPTRRSSDLEWWAPAPAWSAAAAARRPSTSPRCVKSSTADARPGRKLAPRRSRSVRWPPVFRPVSTSPRSEEHTSELQSRFDLVCRLLLEKK